MSWDGIIGLEVPDFYFGQQSDQFIFFFTFFFDKYTILYPMGLVK